MALRGEASPRAELRIQLLRDPHVLLACGLGIGLVRAAPGTFGSVFGVAIAAALLGAPMALRIVAGIGLVSAGFLVCGAAARRIGMRDHPGIVIDEIAAMYVVLLAVPPSLPLWTLAFGLFRLFDIWKPWPIRDLDHRLSGSPGIMLDDLAAAVYAAILAAVGAWLMS
ncbi:MAG TPA: phosphatidylglycerophosphatase A [Woeseiaceae bacterium]|jgi:phosphatidylglycerophosphatase A|nr:phosphatidylglycerophosphatase A [Woeseiaceae bacterium]